MQTLKVDLDWQTRVIRVTLTLTKYEDKILNSMNQTKEKWDFLVSSKADF